MNLKRVSSHSYRFTVWMIHTHRYAAGDHRVWIFVITKDFFSAATATAVNIFTWMCVFEFLKNRSFTKLTLHNESETDDTKISAFYSSSILCECVHVCGGHMSKFGVICVLITNSTASFSVVSCCGPLGQLFVYETKNETKNERTKKMVLVGAHAKSHT